MIYLFQINFILKRESLKIFKKIQMNRIIKLKTSCFFLSIGFNFIVFDWAIVHKLSIMYFP
jgi:hypothetical protein